MAMNDPDANHVGQVETDLATRGYPLPCGRDVEQVWDRMDAVDVDGSDAHDLDCRHCDAARASLTVLRELTGQLADDDDASSPDLTSRIMSAIRAEVRRHDLIPLPTSEIGRVRISVQAVAAVLRFAADTVDGVHARHCRVSTTDAPDHAIEVELSIAVDYHEFASRLLADVRERVTAAASARVGVRLARLDLIVADLYDA